MVQLTDISTDIKEIKLGLSRLGLNLSDAEFNDINLGNSISLDGINLSEIGSIFIMASAIAGVSGNHSKKKPITFGDLPKLVKESSCCSGISIHCWRSDSQKKRCLHLTLIDGKPAVRACYLL